jgi:branched-chain amino acid transport system permease protein
MMQTNKTLIIVAIIICSLMFPFFANNIWLSIITSFLIYSSLALSQDLILGKAGIYAMGHAMFFGIGAYTFAILINTYNINLFIAFIASGIITYILGLIIINPIKHLRGDYFLVVSLGLNIIFINIINNDPFNLTGGPNGIFAINFPTVLGVDLTAAKPIYYLALIFLTLIILLLHRLNYSKFGRAIYYLNHDHIAAKSVGIKTGLNKGNLCTQNTRYGIIIY